jgi:hypothetical protein
MHLCPSTNCKDPSHFHDLNQTVKICEIANAEEEGNAMWRSLLSKAPLLPEEVPIWTNFPNYKAEEAVRDLGLSPGVEYQESTELEDHNFDSEEEKHYEDPDADVNTSEPSEESEDSNDTAMTPSDGSSTEEVTGLSASEDSEEEDDMPIIRVAVRWRDDRRRAVVFDGDESDHFDDYSSDDESESQDDREVEEVPDDAFPMSEPYIEETGFDLYTTLQVSTKKKTIFQKMFGGFSFSHDETRAEIKWQGPLNYLRREMGVVARKNVPTQNLTMDKIEVRDMCQDFVPREMFSADLGENIHTDEYVNHHMAAQLGYKSLTRILICARTLRALYAHQDLNIRSRILPTGGVSQSLTYTANNLISPSIRAMPTQRRILVNTVTAYVQIRTFWDTWLNYANPTLPLRPTNVRSPLVNQPSSGVPSSGCR